MVTQEEIEMSPNPFANGGETAYSIQQKIANLDSVMATFQNDANAQRPEFGSPINLAHLQAHRDALIQQLARLQ
jgi:hypothetical protein